MKKNHDLIEVEARLLKETDKAFYIECLDMEVKTWVPRSEVQDNHDGTFTMPEWLAIEKELV